MYNIILYQCENQSNTYTCRVTTFERSILGTWERWSGMQKRWSLTRGKVHMGHIHICDQQSWSCILGGLLQGWSLKGDT